MSSVLYVKGLDPQLVYIHELVSLFDIYGPVEMAVIHKLKDFALIKYRDEQSSERALKYLNKVCLYGRKMSIFFSKYNCIEEKRFHNQKDYYYADDFSQRKSRINDKTANYESEEDRLVVSKFILIDLHYASHVSPRLSIERFISAIVETIKVHFIDISLLKNSSSQAICVLELPTVSDSLASIMRLKTRLSYLGFIRVYFSNGRQD